MITYEDCLALSGLTEEEVAAIAAHEQLPSIVALEQGVQLCATYEGKLLIRRMILEDADEACRHGDLRTAGRLGLVLHHFIDVHLDRRAAEQADAGKTSVPSWVRERLDEYLARMLQHFGLGRGAQERFAPEMDVARMCCAACTEIGRCRQFLDDAGGAETPAEFCPNAPLLEELDHSVQGQPASDV